MFLCPNCNVGMTQIQRAGIELDVCPQCRGVWMDRGELDKILENERASQPQFAEQPQRAPAGDDYRDRRRYDDDDDDYRRGGRRRGGFSLFDIFD